VRLSRGRQYRPIRILRRSGRRPTAASVALTQTLSLRLAGHGVSVPVHADATVTTASQTHVGRQARVPTPRRGNQHSSPIRRSMPPARAGAGLCQPSARTLRACRRLRSSPVIATLAAAQPDNHLASNSASRTAQQRYRPRSPRSTINAHAGPIDIAALTARAADQIIVAAGTPIVLGSTTRRQDAQISVNTLPAITASLTAMLADDQFTGRGGFNVYWMAQDRLISVPPLVRTIYTD
jgi:hypothetical protein